MKKHQKGGKNGAIDVKAQAEAARALKCNVQGLATIKEQDPFNPNNTISGFMCKDEGEMFGSMFIAEVNGVALPKPLVIYGMPTVNDVHKGAPKNRGEVGGGDRGGRRGDARASSSEASSSGESRNPWLVLEPSSRMYIANKWNGVNLTVYKYHNEKGHQCVSVMPRGAPFLKSGDVQTLLCTWLQIPRDSNGLVSMQGGATTWLRSVFPLLEQPEVQSVTYEMLGRHLPQLVRYAADVQLEPLLATTYDGTLIPAALLSAKVIPAKSATDFNPEAANPDPVQACQSDDAAVLTGEFGPFDFHPELLASFAKTFRTRALQLNKEFRTQNNLLEGYRTEHFVVEGKVIFLLNDFNGTVSRSSLFKLKPVDTIKSHVEVVDVGMQTQFFEALEKIYSKGLPLSPTAIQKEMGFSDRLWARLGDELMRLAQNRPIYTQAASAPSPKLLVIMGLPGSGKSTIANKLTQIGWVRVNQDEMGTRKAVEASAKVALQKGQNVIVDRCNFDFDQRSHFLDLAFKTGVKDVRCLWLDTPAEVCKQRVSVRKDHPTIPEGDAGISIIDRFGSSMVAPMRGEGFCQIVRASTEEEVGLAFETFAALVLPK